MIPIYIGSSERFAPIEPVIVGAIQKNAALDTPNIRVIRPQYIGMPETGCTGFSNVRYAVPELLRANGEAFGVYLDIDMLVLGDIAELADYYTPGFYACMHDRSTEVGVVCSSIEMPPIAELGNYHKSGLARRLPVRTCIPWQWNVEDAYYSGTKLIHYTDLKTQPWFYDNHPSQKAAQVWEQYAANTKSF